MPVTDDFHIRLNTWTLSTTIISMATEQRHWSCPISVFVTTCLMILSLLGEIFNLSYSSSKACSWISVLQSV